MKRVAVIRFPGSNCDQDAFKALNDVGLRPEYVWHTAGSLDGFDGAFVPGGFSYGDYLRAGAIASRSPVMREVIRMAEDGKPVLGACNGFQILCEAGLLPGALVRNSGERFVCAWTPLEVADSTPWTARLPGEIRLPIAHGEGRYVIGDEDLAELEGRGGVAFRYTGVGDEDGPNGSRARIAGVVNAAGNVLGMMPHPERATRALLGGTDGALVLQAFAA